MRKLCLLLSLLAGGLIFGQLTNADDKALPSPPAAEAVRARYVPVANSKAIIRSKVVIKTGDTPDSLSVVSCPTITVQNGQTSMVEISASNGQTIQLEITNEVVQETKD